MPVSLVAVASVAAVWVFSGGRWLSRPSPRRLGELVRSAPSDRSVMARRRVCGGVPPRQHQGERQRLRAAAIVAAAALATVVAPPALPAVVGALLVLPAARARQATRRRDRAEIVELPEVAALLGMAVDAGFTVGAAVDLVARRLSGPVAGQLRSVRSEVAVGRRLADALDAASDRAGPAARSLLAVLADGVRSGAAVGSALQRLAADGREMRRRQAEVAARRLPIKLLFPLVGCVLPAFALLTVVPVVAGALRSLRH